MGWGYVEGGEKEVQEEGEERLCKEHGAVLCSLSHILIFPMVLKATSLAALSGIYCPQAGLLPLSSRCIRSAAFSTSQLESLIGILNLA